MSTNKNELFERAVEEIQPPNNLSSLVKPGEDKLFSTFLIPWVQSMKAKDHQLIVLPQEGEKEVSEHRRKYEWEKVMKNPCLTNVSVGCEAIHFMMFEQQWDIVFVDEIEEEDKSLSIKNELVAWFALVGLRWALRDHRVSMFLLQRLLRGLKNHPKNNFNDWMELFIAACQTIVDTKGEVLASFLPNYALKTNINLDPLRDAAKHLSHLLHYFCLSRSFLKGPSPKGFHDINQIRLLFDRKAEELIGFPKQHGWVFGTVVSPRKEKEPLPDFEFYGGAGEIFNSFALYDTFLDGPHGKYIYAKEILDTHIRMVKKILYREALFLGFHEKTSHGRFSEALPDAELLVKHFSDEEGSFLRLVHVCLCLEDRKKAAEVCQSGVTRFPDSFDLKDLLVGMMSEENDAHGPFRHRKIYFRPSTFRKFLVETVNENWESEPLGECPPLFWIDLPPRIIGDSALEETVLKRGWEEFSKRREGKKVIGVISSPSIIIPLIEWCPGVGPFILTIFRDKEGCEVLLMLDNFPGVSQKTTSFEATKKILPIGTEITIKEPFLTQFPVLDRPIPLFSIYTNNPSDIDVHPSSSSSLFPSFLSSFCLGCGKKGGEGGETLKGCSKCRIGGFYCGKSCQKRDWKLHKKHH